MKICLLIDTKPKGLEYMRAGSIVDVDDAEGSRLIYLGWAKEVKKSTKKTSAKK